MVWCGEDVADTCGMRRAERRNVHWLQMKCLRNFVEDT